jgi:hypothetical protein
MDLRPVRGSSHYLVPKRATKRPRPWRKFGFGTVPVPLEMINSTAPSVLLGPEESGHARTTPHHGDARPSTRRTRFSSLMRGQRTTSPSTQAQRPSRTARRAIDALTAEPPVRLSDPGDASASSPLAVARPPRQLVIRPLIASHVLVRCQCQHVTSEERVSVEALRSGREGTFR